MKNFFILIKLIVFTIISWFTPSPHKTILIDTASPQPELMTKLKDFEASFKYPYSDTEEFTIRHGMAGDYFAFFKALGTPYYYVTTCTKNYTISKIIDGQQIDVHHKAGEVAAAACLVLRKITTRTGDSVDAWYVCDLKVAQDYQGEHIPLQMAQRFAARRFFQCPRGYGIAMNPLTGDPKAARIFKKHGPLDLQTHTLNLYTLTAQQANAHYNDIHAIMVRHGYIAPHKKLIFKSTNGMKDYIIFNNLSNKTYPWNLVHLQKNAGQSPDAHEEAAHMLCAVEGTPLNDELQKLIGTPPSSTAQIISYGMENVDFNFLTSNQI